MPHGLEHENNRRSMDRLTLGAIDEDLIRTVQWHEHGSRLDSGLVLVCRSLSVELCVEESQTVKGS